ncbi:ACP-like protein [Rhizoclosmatium globosum]|uniref:Acyl carrier protein n=1 Tax=Rhizoclosmatium globosum TaxID=329046 RepID=A0A1Y2C5K5_9FUNG|nr:ACP-like protein [Rhizoclosmatium globosum]|eukprot:ORY42154.1 ACP-like protein [Rhizoclosmatium globosum]
MFSRVFTSSVARTATSSFAAVPRATPFVIRAAAAATPLRFYGAGPSPLSVAQVQERVLNVLKDFDKVDASKLTLDSHFITDLGLDSLDQVEITIAIEEEFNIELSDRDADDILTPRAAADKVPCPFEAREMEARED